MRFPPLWKLFESKNSPEFPNCDHTRRIHPWKSVPLKRREKRNLLFRSRFSPLLEIRSLLFYKFPLSFFFRRMKMKRQYLSMNKRGEVVKGDKKKKKRKKNTTPDTLSSILLPRVVQVECHSVQTYPLPRAGRGWESFSQKRNWFGIIAHDICPRKPMQSSYDGKLCYNAVYSQWGRKKHITDAQKEREREREHRGLFHGYCCVQFI